MIRILAGDCCAVMAEMPEASVDSIVTDPPYELGFMGKDWDRTGVANDSETWRAALRVLKPGGHLLAFSGTRTYHRMVCAIEDAGFEIRDMILWHYGSGFPKSLNLDNERGKLTCGCEDRPAHSAPREAENPVCDVRDARPSSAQPRGSVQGDVLQLFVPGADERAEADGLQRQHEGPAPSAAIRAVESGVEGRCDPQAAEGELQGRPLRSSAGVGEADGPQGRLHHGASARDGADVRLPADAAGGGGPRGPQPEPQRAGQSQALPDERGPQARGGWPLCVGCGKPRLPRGLGTALKPATEPIVVARKPLTGTVAANVLQFGTGALNIDGCRVSPVGPDDYNHTGNELEHTRRGRVDWRMPDQQAKPNDLGRWPANIIHDGSDEVLAAFPWSKDGVTGARTGKGGDVMKTGFGAAPEGHRHTFGSEGSAARFFYTAKASAYDRNDGTYDLPQTGGEAGHRTTMGGGPMLVNDTAKDGVSRSRPRGNHHPTVKPTDLMRYLCRLVTPPGGVVLDPFAGSGSTLKAAELEGFSAIGIELDPTYVAIAQRRISSDAPLFAEVEVDAGAVAA